MKVSAKVRIPPADVYTQPYARWLITKVGLQTLSWEWVFEDGEIFVAFYNDRYVDEFKKAFGI